MTRAAPIRNPRLPSLRALLLGLGLNAIRLLVIQIQGTGAVPGDEFSLAGFLYGILPALSLLTAIILTVRLLLLVGELRRSEYWRDRALALGALISVPLAFLSIAATVVALLIAILRGRLLDRSRLEALEGAEARDRDRIADALVALGPPDFLRWWLGLGFVAALGAFLIAFAESFIYTSAFTPELFEPSILSAYRARLADLAIMFGMAFGIGFLLPVVHLRLFRSRSSATDRILAATSSVAGLASLLSLLSFAVVVGQEILRTGVVVHTLALHLVAHLLWCRRMRRNLDLAGHRLFGGEEPEARAAWLALYQALLLLPVELLPGRLRRAILESATVAHLVAAGLGACWLLVFVLLSYPELEDFRIQFISIAVVSGVDAFLLASLSLLFAWPAFRRSRSGRLRSSAMAGVALFGLVFSFQPLPNDVAAVVNEYSRFGFMLKMASVRELIRPRNRIGFEPTDLEFPWHGEGEDRLDAAAPDLYRERRPPIVIVLWDAARPDHMGPYGYPRPTTPNLDRLAAESVIFERAYSGSTATSCGVRHLMTGRYSSRYMLSKEHAPFFLHALRPHGYHRFLITAIGSDYNGVSLEAFRRNAPPAADDGSSFVDCGIANPLTEPGTVDRQKSANMIREWERIVGAEGPEGLDGSLSYLHLTGTHFPWRGSPPLEDLGPRPEDRYDAEMIQIDRYTGEVFDSLRELGVWDRAIVVLVADHGTGLRDHGRYAGFMPYEEQIRVPLLIKAPGFAPRRVREPVATIDLAPTLLALFEPGAANPYHGVALTGLMSGRVDRLERRVIASLCAFEDAYSLLLDGRWKLHFHRYEDYGLLYDLQDDPLERRNLFEREPDRRAETMALMAAFLWEGARLGYGNPNHYWDWEQPRRRDGALSGR